MAGTARAGGIRVRRARSSDISQLALLAGQLGYPSSEDEIRERLAGIEAAPEHALFVAESADGKLAGFLNVYVMRTIDSDARTEIAALVVDDAHRSLGVGKVLIEQAEAWARENGCADDWIALECDSRAGASILRAARLRALQDAEGFSENIVAGEMRGTTAGRHGHFES